MFGKYVHQRSRLGNFLTLPFCAINMTLAADPPMWWSLPDDTNHAVIDPAVTDANPRGPANIGQAKFMVKRALDALRDQLPTVAAEVEANLVGVGKPIATLDVPAQPDVAWHEKQKAPLLVGQLKAIADPFYNRLNTAAPQWLLDERAANMTQFSGTCLPWPTITGNGNNHAMATIGQLKAVFALHFDQDSDADFASDLQNCFVTGSPTASALPPELMTYLLTSGGDYDGDGIDNATEIANATNPFDADSDHDGIPDGDDNHRRSPDTATLYQAQTFSVWTPRE